MKANNPKGKKQVKRSEQTPHDKDIQLAGKYMKRYSASHSIKEFQLK